MSDLRVVEVFKKTGVLLQPAAAAEEQSEVSLQCRLAFVCFWH